MKIEKLNDKQIKIFLNHTDLEERDIKISELAYGSEKAQSLFKDMMEKATQELGFYVDTNRFIIEAIPYSSDSIVLIITKLSEDENFLEKLGAYKNVKKSDISLPSENTDICIYAFSSLDTLSSVSQRLLYTYKGKNALYKYSNTYYLVLDTSEYKDTTTLNGIMNEYGEKRNATHLSEFFFIEHGETIIKDKAIEILSTL